MKTWTHGAAALGLLVFAGAAQAALVDRGGGMIYDTVLNITWLQDWNHAKTSGYAAANAGGSGSNAIYAEGYMGWDVANAWANNLVYGGFDDWRLPTMRDTGTRGCDLSYTGGTDCGTNVQTASGGTVYSEMAHLWYSTLGNLSVCTPGDAACSTAQPGWGLTNAGPFSNMRSGGYWSGLEYAPGSSGAWVFLTYDGGQGIVGKASAFYAVAVRPGDVSSAVPEPQTWALSLLALGAAATVRRRRTACVAKRFAQRKPGPAGPGSKVLTARQPPSAPRPCRSAPS